MRRRFFWSIFGVAALVVVLLFGVAVGTVNTVRTNATRAEMERAARAVGELLADRLEDRRVATVLSQGGSLDEFGIDVAALRRAAGGSELTFFAIDASGDVIGRPAIRSLGLDTEALRSGEIVTVDRVTVEGTVLGVAVPVSQTVRDTTAVVLLSRSAPVAIEAPRGSLGAVLAVVAVLAAVLARILSMGLTRRLGSVADAASALSGGDRTARAEVGGADEVHTVAEAFNRMADQMEASRERERQFLLAVGHDLRTPLTTITGYAEALEDGLGDPREVRRIAGVMSVEVTRLRRLIEDVMVLARLESSEFDLRPEPVDVAAHVSGLVEPYLDRASAVGVFVETEIDPTGRRMVDPDRIGQIVANLCDNALRYTPETGSIVVRVEPMGSFVELSVADSGPGVDAEDLPHLFERFYVARRYRGVRPEGSGLGLSIVDALARVMGGSVSAESSDSGSRFVVRFPAPEV